MLGCLSLRLTFDCFHVASHLPQEQSTATIRTRANVCSVQFASSASNLLALGSADYNVYCYDTRRLDAPLCTLRGHSKAVSYVKFVDSSSLVSASTDNTLRLWDLNKAAEGGGSDGAYPGAAPGSPSSACTLISTGHTNEKVRIPSPPLSVPPPCKGVSQ